MHSLLLLLAWAALLRPSLQCGGGGPDMSALADAQRESRIQELKLWCFSNCVSHWSSWSPCTQPCAGGIQNRSREDATHTYCQQLSSFACSQPKYEDRPCNEACPYGVPIAGICKCPRNREGTCCEEEIFCDYLTRPRNGRVSGTWPATVGSVAEFACDEGYQLAGEYEVMHCTRTGWSGIKPTCGRITCTQPPAADPNLILLNPKGGYVFGEHVVYMCQDGYDIVGPESRECREFNTTGGRWTAFAPRCAPISCPDPGIPINGNRNGTSVKFGSVVEFSCNAGYRLVGSTRLECLASKTWFGHIPTCEQISCDPPYVPEHGSVRVRRSETGSQAIFTCEGGFVLVGEMILECTQSGFWDNIEPTCEAVSCDNPGQPDNGYKDGIIYTYPWNISFSCHRGFEMEGRNRITCQQNGEWSGGVPVCRACPINTYDSGTGICESCPANAGTATEASTSLQQCVCNDGFTGVPGGECLEVRCVTLNPPQFGNITACNNLAGGWCNFTCNDGYVMERGTASRTCLATGVWSGQKPLCIPCAMNTYKSSEKSCTSCPEHSETDGPAQMLEGCICRPGFEGPPGGPCVDANECEDNNGQGPCEDECENSVGSYRCRCNRPGYIVDEDDPHACFPEHQCKNITEDEAPRHGGMVCHWFNEQSSIFCNVRCNPGFEHPAKVNDYETCGPTTGFEWSFRIKKNDPDATFPSCVEAFFPNITLEAQTAYFTSNCHDLTAAEQQAVKEEFAEMLNAKEVCKISSTQVCHIKDMGIICGRTTRRRRRDTGEYEDVSEVDLSLNISALSRIESTEQCDQSICDFLRVSQEDCREVCVSAYNRYVKAAMMYTERQLQNLYSDPDQLRSLILRAANRVFLPKSEENIHTSGVQEDCKTGMALINGSCRACEAGQYLNKQNMTCAMCPYNEYQDQRKQEACIPCPFGTYTPMKGSTGCLACQQGFWGANCQRRCTCVHGMCSPFDGSCTCENGYEGDNCDIDIPGCRDNQCFTGVHCSDIPAPETGFTCGACPDGYHGDGYSCSSNALNIARLNLVGA